jgi:tetratricopeptide (TPR) repeat protein
MTPPLDPTQLVVEYNHYGSLAGPTTTVLDREVSRLAAIAHHLRARDAWNARLRAEIAFITEPEHAPTAFLASIAFGVVAFGDRTLVDDALDALDRSAPALAASTAVVRALAALTATDRDALDRAIASAARHHASPATLDALRALRLAALDGDHRTAATLLAPHSAALGLRFAEAEGLSLELLARFADRVQDDARFDASTAALIALRPTDDALIAEVARGYIARSNSYSALATIDAFASSGGAITPEIQALHGRAHVANGSFTDALPHLEAAIAAQACADDPRERAALFEARAQAYIGTQRMVSASADLSEAIRLSPRRASCFLRRATVYAALARPLDAADDLEAAIALSPLDCQDTALGELATNLFNARKYDRAERAFAIAGRDAIARKLDAARVGFLEEMRGAALHFLGRYEDAVRAYSDAIALVPAYGKAFSDRGEALLELGRDEAAFEDLERAVKHGYRIGCTYVARGTYFQRKGEHDRAIAELDEAARLWPTSAQPLELRAKSHEAKGDARRAAEDRERAAVLRATRR